MGYSSVSERKSRQIVRLFSVDLNATQIARLKGLSRNIINKYQGALRQRVVDYFEDKSLLSEEFEVEFEVDKSFFSARRVKGKRGRGA